MDLTDALTFVRARKQGVLTTIRANGRPQLSNILYVMGDESMIRIWRTAFAQSGKRYFRGTNAKRLD